MSRLISPFLHDLIILILKTKTKKETKEFILIVSVVPRVNDSLSCSPQTCPPNFPKEEISLQEEYHCTRFFQQFLTPFIQGRSLNDHTVSRFTDSKMERRWLLHRRCLEDASSTRGRKKRRTHSGRNQVDGHGRGAALKELRLERWIRWWVESKLVPGQYCTHGTRSPMVP